MDMTPKEIIEELYATGFVKNYLRKRLLGEDFIEDCENDIYIMLMEYPRLVSLYEEGGINKIRQLSSGMIVRHISVKGVAERKYRRGLKATKEKIDENIGYEQKFHIEL